MPPTFSTLGFGRGGGPLLKTDVSRLARRGVGCRAAAFLRAGVGACDGTLPIASAKRRALMLLPGYTPEAPHGRPPDGLYLPRQVPA